MLLTYFLNNFEIVPITRIITGIIFVFTFHMRCISIIRSLCFRIFSALSSSSSSTVLLSSQQANKHDALPYEAWNFILQIFFCLRCQLISTNVIVFDLCFVLAFYLLICRSVVE
jgi:hypothetical protein